MRQDKRTAVVALARMYKDLDLVSNNCNQTDWYYVIRRRMVEVLSSLEYILSER